MIQPTKINYDSEFCGRLPLNRINVVQPHGALLVLHPETLAIVQVSENTNDIIGIEAQDMLETHPERWLDPDSMTKLSRLAALPAGTEKLPEALTFRGEGNRSLHAIIHRQSESVLIEVEAPLGQHRDAPTFAGLYGDLKYTMAAVNSADTLNDACLKTLTELKRLSGFDRLMVYRFDTDWNGTVIAELHEEAMEPYLELRFPASDVPKSARDLYFHNPYRLIPDRGYTPVKLLPVLNPLTGTFTDLTPCNLRGVAAVHLEYLANMGVQASMSTRILVDGKLWGLVSCHHRTPKHPSYEECAVFELIAGVLSARIEALTIANDGEMSARLQKVQASLMERLFLERDLARGLLSEGANLCGLFRSSGAAYVRGRQVATVGDVPNKVVIEELTYWLQANHGDKVKYWNRLAEAYEPATAFTDVASGLISVPIRPDRGEFLLGFRPEQVKEVNWGGNPDEAITMEEDGVRYHPRRSFRIWKKTLRGTAEAWSDPEIITAERFRNFVQEFLLRELSS